MNFKMRLYKSFVLLICVSLLAACQPVPPGPPPPVPQSDLGKLKTNLKATDASVRLEAAYELGQRGQAAKDAVDDLIAASTTDPDVQVRVVAAYALGKIGAPVETIAPRLIAILSDQDERTEVRYSATRALGNLGTPGPDVTQVLSKTLALDPDENLRWAAVVALSRMQAPNNPDLLPVLVDALQDPNWYVADQASELLAAWGKESVDFLVGAFRNHVRKEEWRPSNAILRTLVKMPIVTAPRLVHVGLNPPRVCPPVDSSSGIA